MKPSLSYALLAVGTLCAPASITVAADIGTAFTYQGHLENASGPVTDTCDFRFGLWRDPISVLPGDQVGTLQSVTGVAVTAGVFSVGPPNIDFGAGAINGTARWLEIEVKCPGDANFVALSPRVELSPVPHALALPGLYTRQNSTSPNLVGGYSGNQVAAAAVGGTVGGGGSPAALANNRVTDDFGTVSGGYGNQAGIDGDGAHNQTYATVGGGDNNLANAFGATVSGGHRNTASGLEATVGGGDSNVASGSVATVAGGNINVADGFESVVAGGFTNTATGTRSTVTGGRYNLAVADYSTVSGGDSNAALGHGATVAGGRDNRAGGDYSFAGGRQARVRDATAANDADGDEGTFVWADATGVDLNSTGPNQFLIRAGGGVGINTDTPAATLHVNGDTQVNGTVFADSFSSNSPLELQTSGTTRIYADDVTGNVGIGTTTPSAALEVLGSAKVSSALAVDSNTLAVDATNNRVGIGTLTPAEPLDVVGNIHASGTIASGSTITIDGTARTVTSNGNLELHVANGRALRIETNATSSNMIGGYSGNIATAGIVGATISGGGASGGPNVVGADYATVGGGILNHANGHDSTVGGGESNTASGQSSTVAGGDLNTASGQSSTVAGGDFNTASSYASTVGGGESNTASGQSSTVAGGAGNIASGESSTVGGGSFNTADGYVSIISGGYENISSGYSSTVSGGVENVATGDVSTIPGGTGNQANGYCSFAAGNGAQAYHDYTFVWSSGSTFTSTGLGQFLIQAAGGVGIGTPSPAHPLHMASGAHVTAGGVWTDASSRTQKENFSPIDSLGILEEVVGLPLARWNYRNEDAAITHLGPVAEDFRAAFGTGADAQHLAALDTAGVALAAIQGLYEVVQEKDCEIDELRSQIDDFKELETRLARLEALLAESGKPRW